MDLLTICSDRLAAIYIDSKSLFPWTLNFECIRTWPLTTPNMTPPPLKCLHFHACFPPARFLIVINPYFSNHQQPVHIVLCVISHLSVIRARFLSLARSKLRLCSANHRPGYPLFSVWTALEMWKHKLTTQQFTAIYHFLFNSKCYKLISKS